MWRLELLFLAPALLVLSGLVAFLGLMLCRNAPEARTRGSRAAAHLGGVGLIGLALTLLAVAVAIWRGFLAIFRTWGA